jgi:Rrf2 family protein
MKFSTRVRFALRIMVQIAGEEGDKPVFSRKIAATQGISEPYVDQILLPLRTNGLLTSVRGRSGGYRLARTAKTITLLDIVQAVEGEFQLVDCLGDLKNCKRAPRCATREAWQMITENMQRDMKSVNLAALVARQATLQQGASDFVI